MQRRILELARRQSRWMLKYGFYISFAFTRIINVLAIFYFFSACDCHSPGGRGSKNYCEKNTGKCVCKENVEGHRCNTCKPQFYNLSALDPSGCRPCDCDPGGARSNICQSNSQGLCTCHNHIGGRDCRWPDTGFFVPHFNHYLVEAEMQSPVSSLLV